MQFKSLSVKEIQESTSYIISTTILNIKEEFNIDTVYNMVKSMIDLDECEVRTRIYEKLEILKANGVVSHINGLGWYLVNNY